MSNETPCDLSSTLPKPSILVDPCVLLDEHGLWATARLQGVGAREVDLYLPARRSIRRLEIGHGEDALSQLGRGSRQRLLGALDRALAKPIRLVVDPRRSDGESPVLDDAETPCKRAIEELTATLGANSYTVADYAVEFFILEPTHLRLALGATSVFGPHAASLFRRGAANGESLASTAPSRTLPPPSSIRVARYVRTATVGARGSNSIQAQHAKINRYLKELGLRSEYAAVDEGSSGMRRDRSGLDEILRLASRGHIDVVVATSVDRFFRSATQFDQFLLQLRSWNVSVMFVDHVGAFGTGFSVPTRRRPPRR